MLLFYTLEVLKWLIVVRAVISWFVSPFSRNAVVEAIRRVTDPILRPLQSLIPRMGGVDVTPLIAFFLIILLQGLIGRAAAIL